MPYQGLAILFVLLVSACARPSLPSSESSDLASAIKQRFATTESLSSVKETLSRDLLALQNQAIQPIRALIPMDYPEPFFLYGQLKSQSVATPLARTPDLSAAKIALGKMLFFDSRLSYSSLSQSSATISCASCHQPELQFTDARPLPIGVDQQLGRRNSPSLWNSSYSSALTWAKSSFAILELHAKIPLFSDDPLEMGLKGREYPTLKLLLEDPSYQSQLQAAYDLNFPEDLESGRLDFDVITNSLAAFQRTLINFDTRFDRFLQQNSTESDLSYEEIQGAKLFYGLENLASGQTLACGECHSGYLLSDSYQYVRNETFYSNQGFHNTGMYNLDGNGAYPSHNSGYATSAELALDPSLMGKFRTPSLRFVAQTAPYGHDGSLPNLESVLEHYAAGGRANARGSGKNSFTDQRILPGFDITNAEKEAILAFLRTLN